MDDTPTILYEKGLERKKVGVAIFRLHQWREKGDFHGLPPIVKERTGPRRCFVNCPPYGEEKAGFSLRFHRQREGKEEGGGGEGWRR